MRSQAAAHQRFVFNASHMIFLPDPTAPGHNNMP